MWIRHYSLKRCLILIDEYDVPLENAWFAGFYSEMSSFIRSLFESALKTNESLEFAVITGCLRISRESIFTGLNSLEISSVLDVDYGDYFGFLQAEVDEMLNYYGLDARSDMIREWFGLRVRQKDLSVLYHAIEQRDTDTMSCELSLNLQETISFYDYAENFYHGFMAGLLKNMKNYRILSNRESGDGRPDLILRTPSVRGRAIIIEIKWVDRLAGICFYKKECLVKAGR